MPIFDYKCPTCHTKIEIFQKTSNEEKKECPNCSSLMKKQLGQSNFKLNGIGVYKNNTH